MRADRVQITDAALQRLKPPTGGYRHVYDTLSPLGLRVNAGGRKTFFVMVGSGTRQTIGPYPTWTLQAARERARAIVEQRIQGLDAALTFDEAFTLFLDK
ncbi:MAG TPA: Arm DNA-binding domain-containing protein, partial [Beijerinckiaceae bacterium]|nr:Arm DNA-binding domain-containing protein [Beijerinckiaceae bacterium]